MISFLKKLFGFDEKTLNDAGVQIEQKAPYKVEAPVVTAPVVTAPEVTVAAHADNPVKPVVNGKPKKAPAKKKPAAMKAQANPKPEKKPAAKRPAKKPTTTK